MMRRFLLNTLNIDIGAEDAGVSLRVKTGLHMSGTDEVQQLYHSRRGWKSAPGRGSFHHRPLAIATRTKVAFQVHAHLAVQ